MEIGVITPIFLVLAIFTTLPRPTAMQTSSTETTASASDGIISYPVALYVLIGIAAFYSMLTLICCVVAILNCVYGKKSKQKDKRATPYREIKLPMRLQTHLDTIIEESECSRTSSRISLSKRRGKKEEPLSFSNKSALEDLEKEAQVTETALVEDPSGTNLAFANKYALEVERSETKETEDSGELAERGAPITTSFRNVVPMRNMNGNGRKPNDSPLMKYTPRSAIIPPDEVKVPFSEDEAEHKKAAMKLELDGKQHSPHQSPQHMISFEQASSPGSPFRRKKQPAKEIPSCNEKTDLIDIRRKTSQNGGQPSSSVVHPTNTKGVKATGYSHRLPPLARNSPKPKLKSNSVAPGSGSPIRSRPIPKHPVRSSPSQSPFLAKKAILPSVAASSFSPPKNGHLDNSSTSSGSIPTAETLLKELQPVKKKWYIIGTELKLSNRQLSIIKIEHRDSADKCLASLCEQWVELSNRATWQEVVDALKSTLVDEKDLADKLEREYCWESSNSKTSDTVKRLR